MTTSTARQTFRETVARVAAKAKERLPVAVNGRVGKAVALVLQGDVEPQADGTITVYSATDATRRYMLQGTSCTCQDFERGQAPEGWCCHRIAAGIAKRVQELLPQEHSVNTFDTTVAPLGEAPASVNVRLTIAGREVQLTLRDTDETRLLARLEAVLARFPLPQEPAQGPAHSQGPQQGWCAKHQVRMQHNHKDGRSWWSHRTDQGWCKGR